MQNKSTKSNFSTKSSQTSKEQIGSSTKIGSSAKSMSKSNPGGQESLFMDLLVDELKDIYWAEKKLVKSLPKLQKACTTKELKSAFANHLTVTQGHVSRLEQAFELLGKKAQAKKCEAMAGLTKEAEEIIADTESGSITRDVALIIAAQKVEHYEIATYGSLAQLARTIGNSKLADLMSATLAEEKQADELLTNIAEQNINSQASQE